MDLWLADVEKVEATSDGGTMLGGPPRAVWHTTEGSSIDGALAAYRTHRTWPHLTWDPFKGRIVQHVPANRAGRALENPPGGVQTNRQGSLCVQIEVVAFAATPFTDSRMAGFSRILDWLDSLGIPRDWPMGQPLAYGPDVRRPGLSPAAYGLDNGSRSGAVWNTRGGHYAHSQVPQNRHGDPGRIDITRWVATGSIAPPTPAIPAQPRKVKPVWLVQVHGDPKVWITDGLTRRHVQSRAKLDELRRIGTVDGTITEISLDGLDDIPVVT